MTILTAWWGAWGQIARSGIIQVAGGSAYSLRLSLPYQPQPEQLPEPGVDTTATTVFGGLAPANGGDLHSPHAMNAKVTRRMVPTQQQLISDPQPATRTAFTLD